MWLQKSFGSYVSSLPTAQLQVILLVQDADEGNAAGELPKIVGSEIQIAMSAHYSPRRQQQQHGSGAAHGGFALGECICGYIYRVFNHTSWDPLCKIYTFVIIKKRFRLARGVASQISACAISWNFFYNWNSTKQYKNLFLTY
jgi:hypothetical protein